MKKGTAEEEGLAVLVKVKTVAAPCTGMSQDDDDDCVIRLWTLFY